MPIKSSHKPHPLTTHGQKAQKSGHGLSQGTLLGIALFVTLVACKDFGTDKSKRPDVPPGASRNVTASDPGATGQNSDGTPASGLPLQAGGKTFADWCADANLGAETKATLSAVLQNENVKTLDCKLAQERLQKSVTALNLSNHKITDLRPLASLMGLQSLDLSENQVRDLTPLSGLVRLVQLNLAGNQITDVKPLGSLTQLEVLNLATNQLTEVGALGKLVNMKNLSLFGNKISDARPLEPLAGKLTKLAADRNEFADPQAFVVFKNLEVLQLAYNKLQAIQAFGDMKSLKFLYLKGNPGVTASSTCPLPRPTVCTF